eukprot:CAMPEP_0119262592 /NCGR_PEP_ID=MMETSP1329-20130426/2257_1 /TAXON_ID=114041 /ORGANISM="Genus nov. species nov., Strain RCC1024" /LENGTH=268 /DNA_ID=CAMNT_0007262245 /DNA_START=179 /DNA_END=982 /DNA_ORIENTATION=-
MGCELPGEKTHVDQNKARAAYSALDVEMSARVHAERAEGGHGEAHSTVGGHLKTVVFGGLDGILTSFAIVASCAGSNLSAQTVLLLGACNILADALAMGVGEYLSSKSDTEYARLEKSREEWELRNHPEGEVEEMVDLYVGRGMARDDATKVMETMAKYPGLFVDMMMVEELGLEVPSDDANWESFRDGCLMFCAFVAFGSMPLVGYVVVPRLLGETEEHQLFLAACAVTGTTLFLLGAAKASFVAGNPVRLGSETLALGATCAAVAY